MLSAALLLELHDDGDDTVSEADGASAFAELRALLAEGPASLREAVGRRLYDGRIDVAFCRVLRGNLRHALKDQPNKVEVFRRIQHEIRSLLTASPGAREMDQHAPRIADTISTVLPPRLVDASEVLDGSPLRELGKEKGKKNKRATRRVARLAAQVGDRLAASGWVVLDGALDVSDAAGVRQEMERLEPHFEASEIWVGHQAAVGAQMSVPEIRGDRILWMCGHHPKRSSTPWSHASVTQRGADFSQGEDAGALQPCSASIRQKVRTSAVMAMGGARRVQPSERWTNRNLSRMLDTIDSLVWALRESPSAGRCSRLADRTDAMLAVYPATGARFQRHVDNTAGDGRRLSVLCYLNDKWRDYDGGELLVHPEGCAAVSILPIAGRLALFYADTVPHEVCPTLRRRYSINTWYYDTEERAKAVAEVESTGQVRGHHALSDAEHAAAQNLLQAVLRGSGQACADEVDRLVLQANALPRSAAFTVAQVTMGAAAKPDVEPADVAAALRALGPVGLDSLRRDMSLMRHT